MTSPDLAYRLESDLLGAVAVPAGALYGAQTQRAIENFPLAGQPSLEAFPELVRALLLIKQAAAQANAQTSSLPAPIASAIYAACGALLAGGWAGHFPIHYLHGGGGTSANMNANEVLANLAEEALGGRRGEYRLVHPNDHVNLNQSTNDVYPTACHVAILLAWPGLRQSLDNLAAAYAAAARRGRRQMRLARTCLQDAVPVRYSDYFGGVATFLKRRIARLAAAVEALHAVNLGGTIVGRRKDVPVAYFSAVIPHLRQVTGDPAYRRAADLFDAAQNPDPLAEVSASLDLLARGLVKAAQDLRLLGSGPQAGLGELRLPAVQPGSSIMPGKVNPVLPEFLIQAGLRVIGNHAMCTAALDHGELDLNVWESAMIFPILDSMHLLESAVEVFAARCVAGLEPVVEVNHAHVHTLIPRLTTLAQAHGYRAVSDVCRLAAGDLQRLEILLQERFGDH
jgi:aspartate ammonia-lyase